MKNKALIGFASLSAMAAVLAGVLPATAQITETTTSYSTYPEITDPAATDPAALVPANIPANPDPTVIDPGFDYPAAPAPFVLDTPDLLDRNISASNALPFNTETRLGNVEGIALEDPLPLAGNFLLADEEFLGATLSVETKLGSFFEVKNILDRAVTDTFLVNLNALSVFIPDDYIAGLSASDAAVALGINGLVKTAIDAAVATKDVDPVTPGVQLFSETTTLEAEQTKIGRVVDQLFLDVPLDSIPDVDAFFTRTGELPFNVTFNTNFDIAGDDANFNIFARNRTGVAAQATYKSQPKPTEKVPEPSGALGLGLIAGAAAVLRKKASLPING